MKRTRSLTAPFATPRICPFLIMFIASYPFIVRRAVLKEPNPIPGLTSRFMNRWSCSTMLLRYLTGRSEVVLVRVLSAIRSSIAFGNIAAFLSTFRKERRLVMNCFQSLAEKSFFSVHPNHWQYDSSKFDVYCLTRKQDWVETLVFPGITNLTVLLSHLPSRIHIC